MGCRFRAAVTSSGTENGNHEKTLSSGRGPRAAENYMEEGCPRIFFCGGSCLPCACISLTNCVEIKQPTGKCVFEVEAGESEGGRKRGAGAELSPLYGCWVPGRGKAHLLWAPEPWGGVWGQEPLVVLVPEGPRFIKLPLAAPRGLCAKPGLESQICADRGERRMTKAALKPSGMLFIED